MKNILKEKSLVAAAIFITLIIFFYLAKTGRVTFAPFGQATADREVKEMISKMSFKEKEYRLNYGNLDKSPFIEIVNFEPEENWQGGSIFDDRIFVEGRASLVLNSRNYELAYATLSRKLDLEKSTVLKLFVNLESEPTDIEDFNLVLTSEEARFDYRFSFRSLVKGWNMLIAPKNEFITNDSLGIGWGKIDRIKFTLASRPRKMSTMRLDYLWAEGEVNYLRDWKSEQSNRFGLSRRSGDVSFLAISFDARSLATIREITYAKDYIFRAKFTPLGQGGFGLFLRGDYKTGYGYYFMMNGVRENSWQVFKIGVFNDKSLTVPLAKGSITGLSIGQSRPFWLEAKMSGNKLLFRFSLDGKDFTDLGTVDDNSFSGGEVGIVAHNQLILVNEILFSQ